MSLSPEQLQSLVKSAVAEAMKGPESYECKDCGYSTADVDRYIDHKTGEIGVQIKELGDKIEEIEVPTTDKFLEDCKDGVCKIVEETYNVTKKGEEEDEGLFG